MVLKVSRFSKIDGSSRQPTFYKESSEGPFLLLASNMSKDQVKYSASITHNNSAIQYVHDVTGLVFGTAAGILKVESLQGIAFFVLMSILSNLLFYILKLRGRASQYFERPLKDIYLKGLARSVSGYLMMWCLVTALCE